MREIKEESTGTTAVDPLFSQAAQLFFSLVRLCFESTEKRQVSTAQPCAVQLVLVWLPDWKHLSSSKHHPDILPDSQDHRLKTPDHGHAACGAVRCLRPAAPRDGWHGSTLQGASWPQGRAPGTSRASPGPPAQAEGERCEWNPWK